MPTQRNATGGERKFWGVAPVLPGSDLMAMSRQMEDVGFEGAFALQIYGPPFVPLAVIGAATERLKIGSGVAVAGARSPFETAYAAIDLDRITNGRFVLGLGTSIPSTTVGAYGAPPVKPLAHLRDTVAAVRHIVKGAHKGLEPYQGEYYQADYREMIVTAPPVREHIPIWIGAMRDKLLQLALEIGDGLMGHSLWTKHWIASHINPIVEQSLASNGRARGDLEFSFWPWIAVNNNRQQAIDDARPTVAYYASIKGYEGLFEAHGYLKEARICQQAHQGDVGAVLSHVPDEMVLEFVACGPVDEVMEQIEPFWETADSLCPMTPFRCLSLEQLQFYNRGVFELVTTAKR